MSEIRIAANLISTTAAWGHLQIVYVNDQGYQSEIEVQSDDIFWPPYYFVFPEEREHTANTPNYGEPARYYTVTLDLGDRPAGEVWTILQGVHERYRHEGLEISYGLSKNSNSYANTLLGMVGVDLQDYLPQLQLGMIADTPGDDADLLQISTDAVPLTLSGTSGTDVLRGGLYADEFFGGAGDDLVYGRQGNDTFHSSDGADRLFGGEGNDTFKLDVYGKDFAIGGDGDDIFEFDYLAPWDPTVDFNNLTGTYHPTIVWGGSGADEFRFTQQEPTTSGGMVVISDPNLTEENVADLDYTKVIEYYFSDVITNFNEYPEIIVINPDPDDFITFDGYRFGGDFTAKVVYEDTWLAPGDHEAGTRWYGYDYDGWVYDPLVGGVTTSPSTYNDQLWLRELAYNAGMPAGYPRVSIWGYRNGDFGIEFDDPVVRIYDKGLATNWEWEPDLSAGYTTWSEMYAATRFSFPFSTFTLPQPSEQIIQDGAGTFDFWARGYGDNSRVCRDKDDACDSGAVVRASASASTDSISEVDGSDVLGRIVMADQVGTKHGYSHHAGADDEAKSGGEGETAISLADLAASSNYPADLWYEPEPIGGVI